jgi:hypothetical protein
MIFFSESYAERDSAVLAERDRPIQALMTGGVQIDVHFLDMSCSFKIA